MGPGCPFMQTVSVRWRMCRLANALLAGSGLQTPCTEGRGGGRHSRTAHRTARTGCGNGTGRVARQGAQSHCPQDHAGGATPFKPRPAAVTWCRAPVGCAPGSPRRDSISARTIAERGPSSRPIQTPDVTCVCHGWWLFRSADAGKHALTSSTGGTNDAGTKRRRRSADALPARTPSRIRPAPSFPSGTTDGAPHADTWRRRSRERQSLAPAVMSPACRTPGVCSTRRDTILHPVS